MNRKCRVRVNDRYKMNEEKITQVPLHGSVAHARIRWRFFVRYLSSFFYHSYIYIYIDFVFLFDDAFSLFSHICSISRVPPSCSSSSPLADSVASLQRSSVCSLLYSRILFAEDLISMATESPQRLCTSLCKVLNLLFSTWISQILILRAPGRALNGYRCRAFAARSALPLSLNPRSQISQIDTLPLLWAAYRLVSPSPVRRCTIDCIDLPLCG